MKTNVQKIKDEVENIISSFKGIREKMDELHEWDSIDDIFMNFKEIGNFASDVVILVEYVVKNVLTDVENLQSEDKLNAAVAVLDEAIKLEGFSVFLEFLDEYILKAILSSMVWTLNIKIGKDWDLNTIRNYLIKYKKYVSFLDFIK